MLLRQLREFNLRVERKKLHLPLPDDIVLLVEHLPVYTLGRHGLSENLYISREALEARGVEFFEIDRGGDITYHGPGQLTAYPIIDLSRYGLGVKDYVTLLEECVIRTIASYGIKGERIEGKTGVWVGKGSGLERKISAIGIKCSRYITMHGVALNVGNDLSGFEGINPCGLNMGVTSISKETGGEVDFNEVKDCFWNSLLTLLQPHTPFRGNS